MNFANVGIPVTVVEVAREALDRGLAVVRKNYETTAAKGRLTSQDVEKRLGLIRGTTDFAAISDADIVVEAVFEEMPIKKQVFARLDAVAKADALLATNTSTLDVDKIASATARPESVIGMHFFSPANVMRLVEVVRGAKTSKTAVATAMAPADASEGAGARRRVLRLRRQPHAPRARSRGRQARARRRPASSDRQGALRFRVPDGPLRHARPRWS